MREDLDLLVAWRGGDELAGNELVGRYFTQIYGFFRNKVDAADVDDLTQRTFLKCTESVEAFRGEASFRTYLFVIARNELLQLFRRRSPTREAIDFSAISVAALGTTPSQFAVRRREHQLLLEALRQLPLNHQIALELYFWEDLSGPELARVLGVPEGTARTWLRRARLALADRIEALRGQAVEGLEPTGEGPREPDTIAAWAAELRELNR